MSRSSTIAQGPDTGQLWVTSPDDDQVVEIAAADLSVGRRLSVTGRPEELTVLGDRLLVTTSQGTDLEVIDLGRPTAAAAPIALPCGGARGVVTVPTGTAGTPRDLALVTCPTDDLVAVVDLAAGATLATVPLPGRPVGIVRSGETLTVSTQVDGVVHTWALDDLVDDLPGAAPAADAALEILAAPEAETTEPWVDGERTASLLGALDVGPDGPVGVYQVVDNVRKLSSRQIEGDATYGTPLNGRARLEAAVVGDCGARFADFADPARLLSGPVALAAAPEDDLVWVVGQFSQSVSVVRCDGGDPSGRSATVASFGVGAGARGIVLSADGTTAFVDVGFDHAIARLDLPEGVADVGPIDPIDQAKPAQVVRRDVTDLHLSPLAQEGRRMFADGTNTHLTPFGVVTCASCHPAAGDDGLRWRIETQNIARKLRRTPATWQVDAAAKPLHWDGQFATSDELIRTTVRELLGGDGLLVDPAAITAYMAEVPAPPAAPVRTAADEASVQRGREIFESDAAGCASCHSGDAGTDGLAHDVLPAAEQQAAQLDAVITPPLRAVRGKGPFGHDGRVPTLQELLAQHRGDDGQPIVLAPDQLTDVIAYLRSR